MTEPLDPPECDTRRDDAMDALEKQIRDMTASMAQCVAPIEGAISTLGPGESASGLEKVLRELEGWV